jgi:hypothetical protein
MHVWRYPPYRYRVARPRSALFAGGQDLGAPPNRGLLLHGRQCLLRRYFESLSYHCHGIVEYPRGTTLASFRRT